MHVNVYVLTSLASWSHINHSLRGFNTKKESDSLYLSELVHLDVIRAVKLAGVGREVSELKASIGDERRRSSTTLHSYIFEAPDNTSHRITESLGILPLSMFLMGKGC